MKKNLLALLAIIFCLQTFLFSQPPSCPPGAGITPGETCADACANCSFSTYTGTSAGWEGDPPPPDWCSQIQNDQWIGFVASTTSFTITITPSNCVQGQGLQAALYPAGCNAVPLECNPGCTTCGNTPITFSASGIIPGNVYYVVIDGYSQDECDFTVAISPAQTALPVGNPTQISGAASICPGATDQYSILPVANAGYYTWESNVPGVLFNGQPGPVTFEGASGAQVDLSIPVTVPGGSSINICVTPASSCQTGVQRCKTINVFPTNPPTILPPVTVCNEEAPYILPWGELVNESGLYNQNFEAVTGCDSIVFQEVTILPAISTSLVSNICQGDSVTVCGEVYKTSGNYQNVCTSFLGCDSTINLTLNIMLPVASIAAPTGPLSCSQPSMVLTSAPSPSTPAVSIKTWRNLATGATSTGDNLVVTAGGDYELCTSMTLSGVSCSVCDTVSVAVDSTIAFLEITAAVSGAITCTSPAMLTANSNMPGTVYTWISPSGGLEVDSVYIAANPGEYVLAAMNGICVDSATVTVSADLDPGITTLSSGTVTCVSSAEVSASSNISGLNYEWIAVDSTVISGPSFTTEIPGIYYLTTTNPANGCTWTGAVMVLENTYAGVTTIAVSPITCTMQGDLTATSDISGLLYSWLTPDGTILGAPSFTTNAAGTYSLTTTNPANGCTWTQTVMMTVDSIQPQAVFSVLNATAGQSDGAISLNILSGTPPFTFEWTHNGMFFSDAQNLVALEPGIYTVKITGANGCTQTIDILVMSTSGTSESFLAASLWKVAPNPASDHIQLLWSGDGAAPGATINGFDAAGKLMFSLTKPAGQANLTIPCSEFPAGMYHIEIQPDSGVAKSVVRVNIVH